MKVVLALARKELMLLVRDKFALFWIFAFPLMFALFFGSIFSDGGSSGRAMSVVVVDEDASDVSAALVGRLDGSEAVGLTREGEGDDAPLERPTLDEARELVQKGKRVAYLRIPRGYGENPYALFGGGGGGDQPALEIGIDPGRRAEAGFLQGVLMEAVFGALQDRVTNPEVVKRDLVAAREEIAASDLDGGQKLVLQTFLGALERFVDDFDPATLEDEGGDGPGGGFGAPFTLVDVTRDRSNQPRSAFDVSFPQALVWGLMSAAMTFAITLVRERSGGTLLRLRLAPITRAQLLAGKALGCFLGCALTMVVLLAFAYVALGVRFDSPPLLALAIASAAACFTGIMMTVSVLGRTENAVAGASWGLLMPFAMIGGGMIPLIAMPDWLLVASDFSPFKWAITAVEGAVWRGYGADEMVKPCAILVGVGIVFFTLGVGIFRKVEG